jgi:hypothetical protein
VNADALHMAVLTEIRQAARFPTRIANLVKRGAEVAPKNTDAKSNLIAVGKRVKEIERRIVRVQLAIETSDDALQPLVDRLGELQRERLAVEGERMRREAQVREQQYDRPEVADIQAYWQKLGEYRSISGREGLRPGGTEVHLTGSLGNQRG